MIPTLPLAFGFANAAILGWLAAAAAPILIHLWMKRVRKETPWAAVRFLQAAIKRHASRLRLQEWILLAVRTAIILLVVFAASKPLLDSLGGLVGAGVRTHRVLVIDASLSMRYESEDGTLLKGAKRLARELVEQSGPGDQFSVCVMGSTTSAPIASPTVDKAAVRRAIAAVAPTDAVADVGAALAVVDGVVESAEKGTTTADRREVIFFSDLTRTAWGSLAGGAGDGALVELVGRAAVSVVDVGVDNATNAAVTDARLVSGTATLRQSVRVLGTVQSFGRGDVETIVELAVDGVAVESRPITLPGGTSTAVEFTHRFRRPGWRRVSVRLPHDALRADDERWLGVEVKPHIAVLCVEGREGAARYVAEALNPGGDADAAIRVEVVSDAQLSAVNLDGFDSVFFCNVAELSRREAERLEQYVRGGGGATFFLGDRVRADRYNAVLGGQVQGNELSRRGDNARSPFRLAVATRDARVHAIADVAGDPLLPVVIGRPMAHSSQGVDPLDYQHPIVKPFRGRQRAGLLTTPIERFFRLETRGDSPEVALATTAAEPLIVTAPVGGGRVAVFATPGSLASVDPATGRPWTVMPAWPSFVPIVRETLRFVSSASSEGPSPLVGDTLTGRFDGRSAGQQPITRPDEEREAVAVEDDGLAWSYPRTDRAGVYSFTDPDDAPRRLMAVNVDPRESDTARVAASELPADIAVRRAALDGATADVEFAKPAGIHRGLLLMAIGLVLVETWLAYWFGRGAQ